MFSHEGTKRTKKYYNNYLVLTQGLKPFSVPSPAPSVYEPVPGDYECARANAGCGFA